MNYAIYKTSNGKHAHIVHRFTQEKCNHRAKAAAREKLHEMWLRVLQHPSTMPNTSGTEDEFQYDYKLATGICVRIRFYIDKL